MDEDNTELEIEGGSYIDSEYSTVNGSIEWNICNLLWFLPLVTINIYFSF